MGVTEKLMRYISIKTPCNEKADSVPTSTCQFNLAEILVEELKELGMDQVVLDERCFVYGILRASEGYEDCRIYSAHGYGFGVL